MRKKERYTDCPVCGTRVPESSIQKHIDSPVCQAAKVGRDYTERGWAMLDGAYAKIAKAAGVPTEEALAGVHEEEVAIGLETSGSKRGLKTTWVHRLHMVTFAPAGVRTTLTALKNVRFESGMRVRALGALWDMGGQEIIDQVETIKRLDGNVRSYVYRLVVEAENRRGVGKTDADSQVPGHGEEGEGDGLARPDGPERSGPDS